jgi:hypothetical protein
LRQLSKELLMFFQYLPGGAFQILAIDILDARSRVRFLIGINKPFTARLSSGGKRLNWSMTSAALIQS